MVSGAERWVVAVSGNGSGNGSGRGHVRGSSRSRGRGRGSSSGRIYLVFAHVAVATVVTPGAAPAWPRALAEKQGGEWEVNGR